ncbi:MAG: ArsR/SmtB family transcription factor [Chloroflexia bacterium]
MGEEIRMEVEFEPADRMVIKDLEALKAVSDPLRLRIMETMLQGARTVKQLAKELKTTPTKLYYHMNLLEQHGLVKVTGTRIVSGIIEKQYQLAAYSIDIDRSLLSPSGPKMGEEAEQLFGTVLDSVRRDITDSAEAGLIDFNSKREPGERTAMFIRTLNQIPESKAKEFVSRFEALLEDFGNVDTNNPDDKVYSIMLAFYPSVLKAPLHKPHKKEKRGE